MMLFMLGTAPALALAQAPALDNDDYQLIVLRKGRAWTAVSTAETQRLQEGHMANIRALWDRGALVAAGPVAGGGEVRGFFILKAPSLAAARELASGDPAVKAGRFAIDVYGWWGPRGIGEAYRRAIEATPNLPDRMRTYVFAFARKGPRWTGIETGETRAGQQAHLERIAELTRLGQVAAAGPLSEAGDYRGIWIFAVGSPDEAARLLADDPLIKAGELVAEFHLWYCAEGVLPAPRP